VAGNNSRDINLVIKARDEATSALQSISAVLEKLGAGASVTSGEFAQVAKTLATVNTAADKAEASFNKVGTAISSKRDDLARYTAELKAAQRTLSSLKSPDAIVGAGRDQSTRLNQIKQLEAALPSLQASIARTSTTIAGLETQQSGMRSSLQQLGSGSLALAEAQVAARRSIDETTAALARQKQAASVAASVNASTGVTGVRATESTEVKADGTRNVATFSALAAREESAAIREAAFAHSLFEAKVREGAAAMKEAEVAQKAQNLAGEAQAAREAAFAHSLFEAKVREGAAAMKVEADAAKADAQAVQRIKDALDPTAAIQRQFNASLAEATRLHKAGKISGEEYAATQAHIAAEEKKAVEGMARSRANAPKVSLFGLAPYETQNLAYQINDVITQLSSGTSLSQTLAQQGGQIFQIFQNRIGPALLTIAPTLAVIAAAATPLVLGLMHAADEAQRLRDITNNLTLSADGGLYDPKKFEESAKALRQFGISADEAATAFKQFVQTGLPQDQFARFARTAQEVADVTGVKFVDAMKTLTEAFGHGSQAVLDYDTKVNFLTAKQRDHVIELANEGKELDAVAYAMGIYNTHADKAGQNQSALTSSTRALSGAWQGFLDWLSHTTIIKGAADGIDALTRSIAGLLNRISGVSNVSTILNDIATVEQRIAGMRAQNENFGFDVNGGAIAANEKILADLRAKLKDAQDATARKEEFSRTSDPVGNPNQFAPAELTQESQKGLKVNEVLTLEQKKQELQLIKQKRHEDDLISVREKSLRLEIARTEAREKYSKIGDGHADTTGLINGAVAEAQAAIDKENEAIQKARLKRIPESIEQGRRDQLVNTAKEYAGQQEGSASLQSFFNKNGINVDPTMTAWCAAFVNAVLGTNGLPKTGSLAARSFLDYGTSSKSDPKNGDIVVMQRGRNTSQGHVGFFQGYDDNGNVKVLGGNQSNGVNTKSFPASDVLDIRRAPDISKVYADEQKASEDLKKKQTEYNAEVQAGTDRHQDVAEAMRIEGDIAGRQLLDAQRERQVVKEIADLREKARKDGVELSSGQVLAREAQIRNEFNASHQKQYVQADVDQAGNKPGVDALVSQREAIQRQLEIAQKVGDTQGFGALQTQLIGINDQLRQMVDNALKALSSMSGPEAEAARAKLQGIKSSVVETKNQFIATGRQFNETFANGVASAIDKFAQGVAQGKNVFKSLRDAFLQFASDFLRQIAQMIIKQLVFNAIGGGKGDGSGGLGGMISTAIISMFHNGGIAGSASQSKAVSPAWFNNAIRYHTGGIAGLAPDEVATVLKTGEEVLTTSDPRHRANGGMGASGGGMGSIKIVNAFDGSEALSAALNTKTGEKALLNWVKNNPGAFKAALG